MDTRCCAFGRGVLLCAVGVLVFGVRGAVGETIVARAWNEALLDAIRIDFPAPTVHSRNLYHTSAAMWDAWAAYDGVGRGVFYDEKVGGVGDVSAARDEAISYAAYRVLSQRYSIAVDPVGSQALFDGVMSDLGYDPSVVTTVGDSPAAVGNRVAAAVLAGTIGDGANEAGGYVDQTGYEPVNDPMLLPATGVGAVEMADPNHWQPLAFEARFTQNGLEADKIQTFVGPNWGNVTPFALQPAPGETAGWTGVDPGVPPKLGDVGDAVFKSSVVDVIRYSCLLDASVGVAPFDMGVAGIEVGGSMMIDISPASLGNRALGTHDDVGYAVNPATGEAYEPELVHVGDYGRVLAEFWADGPASETPPGHWYTLANYVADHPESEKRIGGVGDEANDLEWYVKTYLALGGAVHDAAIGAWGAKRAYDYVRPISMIRYMGGLGQSSDAGGEAYHEDGLPLVEGLIEVITEGTTEAGGKHEPLAGHEGEVAIFAWSGEGEVPEGESAGTGWIRAVEWWPYQRATFVTPAFAAYVSGHSTFSRAAAEVLAAMTGSPYFPGGLGSYTLTADGFLEFEVGPSTDLTLQWATYFDAADEAGISRLYGGIHVAADDFAGRVMGAQIGQDAWEMAQSFFVPEPSVGLCVLVLSGVALGRRGQRLTGRRKTHTHQD